MAGPQERSVPADLQKTNAASHKKQHQILFFFFFVRVDLKQAFYKQCRLTPNLIIHNSWAWCLLPFWRYVISHVQRYSHRPGHNTELNLDVFMLGYQNCPRNPATWSSFYHLWVQVHAWIVRTEHLTDAGVYRAHWYSTEKWSQGGEGQLLLAGKRASRNSTVTLQGRYVTAWCTPAAAFRGVNFCWSH